ncbi:MAG: MarR family transcriptional regulator [Promethearchaeati archaeon SRVP18_Atabeyarchaeia-1]
MVLLVEIFGDSAQVKVLEFLLRNVGGTMMISDVAKGAGVANSTTARVVEPLINSGIAKETKIGKQIRIIKLDRNDEKSKLLLRLVEGLDALEDGNPTRETD